MAQARGVLGSTSSGCWPFSLSSIFASYHLNSFYSSVRQAVLSREVDTQSSMENLEVLPRNVRPKVGTLTHYN